MTCGARPNLPTSGNDRERSGTSANSENTELPMSAHRFVVALAVTSMFAGTQAMVPQQDELQQTGSAQQQQQAVPPPQSVAQQPPAGQRQGGGGRGRGGVQVMTLTT